jgi:hypothetical protein
VEDCHEPEELSLRGLMFVGSPVPKLSPHGAVQQVWGALLQSRDQAGVQHQPYSWQRLGWG